MAKKTHSRIPKGRLAVQRSDGTSQRFLRGMITHDLVGRGLDFDDAYMIASRVRSHLGDRDEVKTAEIRDLVQRELIDQFGSEPPQGFASPISGPEIRVDYDGVRQPFSRGLLARSIFAAGITLDRAYRIVSELEKTLREEEHLVTDSSEIVDRAGMLIERQEGNDAARRYRLVRRIHHLPRPLVIYVGGASGTGKSTLSLELAPILRIYRINATDTIRQVMRMVFSDTILPSLHTSSFITPASQAIDDDPDRAMIAAFEDQSKRVIVGVRAVVERAIAENMSVLVEGVHLHPPMVPFPDLEGACYQVPVMLGTLDEEIHRSRFLSRARSSGRRADRYLENFESIRHLHDHLLQQAETHDIALLDTSNGDPPVTATVRVVTGLLQQHLPGIGAGTGESKLRLPPTLLVVLDGVADRPVRSLGGRTPLQAAETPTFDRLAREGICGLADPISPEVVPDTAAGSLALLGQSPRALQRGPVEALGTDLPLEPGDIALRGNFATVDEEGRIVDRRAGRIRQGTAELAAAIDDLRIPGKEGKKIRVRVAAATEHRLAIVLQGDDLSSAFHGSDPGESAIHSPPLAPRPFDPQDERADRTARLLNKWEIEASRILDEHPVNIERRKQGLVSANRILTRGPGRLHRLVSLPEAGVPLRMACVAGDRTLLGLVRWLDGEPITSDRMTANLDTDIGAKLEAARDAFGEHDLVILHLKGADIAAHDLRPDLKVHFIERIDNALQDFLKSWQGPLRIALASDHATLSESGHHAADPVPVVLWGKGIPADDVAAFDEASAAAGKLGRLPLQSLLGRLIDPRLIEHL